jgi:hypothetical protein
VARAAIARHARDRGTRLRLARRAHGGPLHGWGGRTRE